MTSPRAKNPRVAGSAAVVERYSIGVDIGGTFTDLVMCDDASGRLYNEKVLTTPQDPSLGVLEGIDRILAAHGASAAEVRHVIHGTTLVANAVIERRGSRIALVTTRGFADLLEIGTEWRYDIYDLSMQVPEPLVPRRLRFEVPERLGPDGGVLQALDEAEALAVARRIAASGVAAVAICLLHAFRNPQHERRLREILQQAAPGVVVCISSDVMPEIGEYERTSTTVCNAYVLPVFDSYLKRLTAGLRGRGVTKDLYLMLSDGGTVHESTAAAYPCAWCSPARPAACRRSRRSAPPRASATCCASTWAAPPPRPAWSTAASRCAPPSSRSRGSTASRRAAACRCACR
jgi:N-methylhydantoinase A